MQIFDILLQRYPQLQECIHSIEKSLHVLEEAFRTHKKLLLAGNGGSASDAGHIAGELLKRFCIQRPIPEEVLQRLSGETAAQLEGALPAIALPDFTSFLTAYANDRSAEYSFAQLVLALGQPGDVLWGISTSGNSRNILHALEVARAKSMKIIGLTGRSGGRMAPLCDVCICVPEEETYKIQELHLPIYHALCQAIEQRIFGSNEESAYF